MLRNVVLHLPAEEPMILCARDMIDPIAATAVTLPISPFFLQPHGQEYLSSTVAESLVRNAGMGENNRKDPYHRAAVGLLQKAVLGTKLDVAQPTLPPTVGKTAKGVGDNDRKLKVGRCTVVVFELWQGSGGAFSRSCLLRRYVELMMLIFDRLRIVRKKRRACRLE